MTEAPLTFNSAALIAAECLMQLRTEPAGTPPFIQSFYGRAGIDPETISSDIGKLRIFTLLKMADLNPREMTEKATPLSKEETAAKQFKELKRYIATLSKDNIDKNIEASKQIIETLNPEQLKEIAMFLHSSICARGPELSDFFVNFLFRIENPQITEQCYNICVEIWQQTLASDEDLMERFSASSNNWFFMGTTYVESTIANHFWLELINKIQTHPNPKMVNSYVDNAVAFIERLKKLNDTISTDDWLTPLREVLKNPKVDSGNIMRLTTILA